MERLRRLRVASRIQSAPRLNVRLILSRRSLFGRKILHESLDDVRSDIGCHDEDCVLEIDCTALVIGQTAVVKHLKKRVEHVRMSLFDLIKKHHRIRLATHGLSQLAALVITHIARRRTNKTAYRMTFLILAHIYTRHHVLIVEKEFGKGLCKLGLTHSCRSHEQE